MAEPMQTNLTDYQAPTGWRIKRDHEPLADGDAFSHTHYSVAEHIAPLTFTLDRLRQDSDFAYLSDGSVFAARKYYMPHGGYILTPFTPSETFAEIAPEELAHPAPSVIIIDDPTDGMETINAACGGNGGIVSALPLEEAPDVGQDRSALTDTDRLFPKSHPAAAITVALDHARCPSHYFPPGSYNCRECGASARELAMRAAAPITDPVLPAAGWEATVKPGDKLGTPLGEAVVRPAPTVEELETTTRVELSPTLRECKDPTMQNVHRRPRIRLTQGQLKAAQDASLSEIAIEQPDAPLLPDDYLMAGGKVATSKCPPYHLIPAVSLQMLANQCGLGVKRKGNKAWNALSDNQDVLVDKDFVLERISHVINHALKARDRILNGDFENMETENDFSATFWGGMFLCAAADAMMKEREKAVE